MQGYRLEFKCSDTIDQKIGQGGSNDEADIHNWHIYKVAQNLVSHVCPSNCYKLEALTWVISQGLVLCLIG